MEEPMSIIPKSEILDLTALAEYQTGAVVSRQVVKAAGGNVTLFAFDEGQELSEHTAPFDALVHILDGEVEIKISGQLYQLKAGEGIIMPANTPHALLARKQFKMLLTMINA
jgi:quercetin dioxygenase-like cupin family protein